MYRAGPWPGLTPRGAAVLLGCAALLALGATLVGSPQRPWPDLVWLSIASLVPLALATRVTCMPGAAAAACGAYLLPRTLLSLIVPDLAPPPLLLVPAIAFDVSVWLRSSDLRTLRDTWPGARPRWRKRVRTSRTISALRAGVAGAVFGLVLAAIVPPWAVVLGGDASVWSGSESETVVGLITTVAVDALVGLAALVFEVQQGNR